MKTTPTFDHEVISQRAHRIWELAGKPEGRDTELWLQAENELRAATVQFHAIEKQVQSGAEPARSSKHTNENVMHSTDYAPRGVTVDALHHHRST